MTAISDFLQQARAAFPDIWFRVVIEQTSGDAKPRYRINVVEGSIVTAAGSGPSAEEAIREAKSKRSQAHAENLEAARLLLEANGHTVN